MLRTILLPLGRKELRFEVLQKINTMRVRGIMEIHETRNETFVPFAGLKQGEREALKTNQLCQRGF